MHTRIVPATLLLASALLQGCAPPPAGPVPAPGPLRAATALTDAQVTDLARVLRLEDQRRYDDALLARLADDPAPEIRRRAVTAAGRIGDPAAAPLLLRALADDPDPAVRADAAFALGELGDSSAAVLQALAAVGAGGWVPAEPQAVPVAVEALAALGKLGGAGAEAALVRALADAAAGRTEEGALASARHAAIAREALLTVWKIDEDAAAVRAAAPFLDVPDPEVRQAAAYALMRGAHPSALGHLLALPFDAEHRVRAYTARSLTAVRADSAGVADRAREWLETALDDTHPHVRVNALRALASYGEGAALDRVAALTGDPDPSVAHAAVSALGTLGPGAAPRLAAVVERTALPLPVRGLALEQWARIAPEQAADAVMAWAESRAGDQAAAARYFAARAAGALGAGPAVPLYRRLVADSDARVAVAAAVSMRGLFDEDRPLDPDTHQALVRVLRSQLATPALAVPAAILRTLAPVAGPEDVDLLVSGVHRFARLVDQRTLARSVALAALGALESMVDRGVLSGDDVARRLAAAGPAPADRWVRRAAAALVPAWGPAPDAVAAGELAFYEDVVRRLVAPDLAGDPRPGVRIETPHGPITLELLAAEAPLTVHNFLTLVEDGFFDDGVWHRVIPNFVLQDGAPGGAPDGGPGWAIRDEINRVRYHRGMLGMALSGPDTGGSQWFITHAPQPHLDGGYTIFGRVVEGMDAADRVLQGDPIPAIRRIPPAAVGGSR